MNMETIKQFINIRQDLQESGVIGINVWDDSVQIRFSEMVNLPDITVEPFNYENFKYRAVAMVDGIKFYSIFTEIELEDNPHIKSLIPMVEDVDLSGMKDEVNESA